MTKEEMERQLEGRAAVIDGLQKRVRDLEKFAVVMTHIADFQRGMVERDMGEAAAFCIDWSYIEHYAEALGVLMRKDMEG